MFDRRPPNREQPSWEEVSAERETPERRNGKSNKLPDKLGSMAKVT